MQGLIFVSYIVRDDVMFCFSLFVSLIFLPFSPLPSLCFVSHPSSIPLFSVVLPFSSSYFTLVFLPSSCSLSLFLCAPVIHLFTQLDVFIVGSHYGKGPAFLLFSSSLPSSLSLSPLLLLLLLSSILISAVKKYCLS